MRSRASLHRSLALFFVFVLIGATPTVLATYPSSGWFDTLRSALYPTLPYARQPHTLAKPVDAASSSISGSSHFSWSKLQASRELIWHDCYYGHQCARLSVPLNYSEPDGTEATIALTRYPSLLPADSPWNRGPILVNPGGPGGSGVDMVASAGAMLARIVGPQFDIVGFDPRGIGRSTPRVSFFETAVERELWGYKTEMGALNASVDGLARAWARANIVGRLAAERQPDILGHINTDHTARDMLRITEAYGRSKLQYWGFSYGSVLGSTFAAMFPDKIERLVIDGVADVENYYETLWSNNLIDTDKALESFFSGCHLAGPSGCPFHAPNPDAIAANLTTLYETVRLRPIPVRTETSYGVVDYNRLKSTIFTSLYKPYTDFVPLAQALADLAAGNGTRLFQMTETPAFQCGRETDGDFVGLDPDALTAIMCNDGVRVSPDFKELQAYFEAQMSKSGWAELWAGIRTRCTGWPKSLPKTHFQGPLVGNTSFPIFLIGNTADPVTPLYGAKKTAKGFPGSVVLTQDSPGHCSLAAPSLCTQKYIRDYFVDGTLPKPGVVCSVVGSPFPIPPESLLATGFEDQQVLEQNLSVDDLNILDAIRTLSSSYKLPLLL